MKKIKILIKFIAVSTIITVFIFLPISGIQKNFTKITSASEIMSHIYLQPDYNLFLDKDYLYVDLIIQSDFAAINVLETSIKFETDKLTLAELDMTNSFCNLLINKEVDNTNGVLKISCGTPTSGTSTLDQIARLKFNKIEAGFTKMNIEQTTTLNNDGLGTAIASEGEIHRIYIVK